MSILFPENLAIEATSPALHWQVLEKCQWCGRTFKPTAMKSHAKSCTQELRMSEILG